MRIGMLTALTATLALSCAEKPTPPPLPRTDAPEKSAVASTMWTLATEVSALRAEVERSSPPGPKETAEMARRLDRIAALLAAIDTADGAAKHPLLTTELPGFRHDVEIARDALRATPPDLEKVKPVTDGCRRCHVVAAAPPTARDALAMGSGASP